VIKELRITRITEETPQAKTFELEPLQLPALHYRPGQFLTLVFKTRHGDKRRSYSISSSPALAEPLSITVKKLDNGEFSRFLIHHAKEGDVLHASGIGGFFTLPEKPENYKDICFIAAGSGITPCFSLIKTLLATTTLPVKLIYSNRNADDTIFYSQLRDLEEAYSGRFQVKYLFSDSNDIYSRRLSKWLLDQLIESYFKEPERVLFYICGPFEYMQTVEITLRVHTKEENIRKENYSALPRLTLPVPPDTSQRRVTIHTGGKIYDVNVKYPQSILKAAQEQHIDLPYSCEAGRCGSCVATCVSGKIWMAYNEVLVEKEVQNGRFLTCEGFPVFGDAVIVSGE